MDIAKFPQVTVHKQVYQTADANDFKRTKDLRTQQQIMSIKL